MYNYNILEVMVRDAADERMFNSKCFFSILFDSLIYHVTISPVRHNKPPGFSALYHAW